MEPAVNHAGWINNPDLHWLFVMGRLKPTADVQKIEAQMLVEVRQWLTERSGKLDRTLRPRFRSRHCT